MVLAVARLHLLFAVIARQVLGWVAGLEPATQTVLAGAVSLAAWGVLVPLFFSMTRRQPVDRTVGELSYPVYLLHYTVVLLVTVAGAAWRLPESWRGEAAAFVTILTAILLQATLLGPFESWRQRLVRRRAAASSGGCL